MSMKLSIASTVSSHKEVGTLLWVGACLGLGEFGDPTQKYKELPCDMVVKDWGAVSGFRTLYPYRGVESMVIWFILI